jgi:NTE family protein
VIKPVPQTMPSLVARNVSAFMGLARPATSLLDTAPLRKTLRSARFLDWRQIARNIDNGTVRAVAVVTTEFRTGRTKVFFDAARGTLGQVPKSDDDRAVDYVRQRVTADHVLASSAIPIAFPPVRLGSGRDAAWHMDGGVRLNAPLKPAITLGAKRLVIVASDPPYYGPRSNDRDRQPPPSIQDAADQVLRGAMSDRMIEDLISLAHLNHTLKSAGEPHLSRAGRRLEIIEFVFGGPEVPGTLGARAAETLDRILHGVGRVRRLDLALISRLLRGGPNGNSRGDLVSYLLFEPEFIDAAIHLGRQDAEAILRRPPLWKDLYFPAEAGRSGNNPSGRPARRQSRSSSKPARQR